MTPAPIVHRMIVGIGELAVSSDPDATLVAHGLGSCITVALWDPSPRVAGLLHFLLPDSQINPSRASGQPGAFADTGVRLLFESAAMLGAAPARCAAWLVGGAEVTSIGRESLNVGRRNIDAARELLRRAGVRLRGEAVGGHAVRTVHLSVSTGRLNVTSDGATVSLP